ncbi:MAG: hypothetical protein R3C56_02530 [Pirellulaceae bacterium]
MLIGDAGCGGDCLLAWRFGGGPASLIAAGLAAVYPSAIGMSIIVLSEAIFIPLMLGHLLAWQSAWQTSSVTSRWGYGLLAGGLAGAAVLGASELAVVFAIRMGCWHADRPETSRDRR